MKNIIKRSLALLLVFGFSFNTQLLNEIKEVQASANMITQEQYNDLFTGQYTYGGKSIFQVQDDPDVDEDGNAPYRYFTRGKTATSSIRHRTIALQISRIREGVNPFSTPYSTNTAIDVTNAGNDPHFYHVVGDSAYPTSSSVTYDEEWEYYTVNGTKYTRQYFTIPLYWSGTEYGIETNEVYVSGDTINMWKISYKSLWNQMQYSAGCEGWYDDLQQKIANGETYYFGVDAVKTKVIGNNIYGKVSKIFTTSSGELYYTEYTNPQGGTPVIWTWANWQTAPAKNGSGLTSYMIRDYYNKYYQSSVDIDPVEDPKETPVKKTGTFNLTKNEDNNSNTGNTSGSNTTAEQSQNAYAAPGIFTYNDSDTYELGTAIPTSNEYKNGVILDGWYGNVEISQNTYARTEKTSNYAINYSYTVHHPASGKTVTDPDTGKEVAVDDSWDETINGTEYATSSDMIQSTWQGVYTTISDVDLYQLQNATTINGAGGTISYTENVLTHVPYSITINGTTYTSGESQNGSDDKQVPTFNASESYHVKENNVDTSRITVSVGNMGDNKPSHDAIISAGKGQVQAIWNKRVKNNASLVTLQNDEFTIDGVTYLTNPSEMTQDAKGVWQKGGNINWTYEKDKTHEMAEATTNNIKQDQGAASIPSSVINGYYYTNISATYKSFISSKNQTVTMAIKDNLGDNTSGTVHDELNNSAKPAIIRTGGMSYAYAKSNYDYTINEPVVVHTPVISPIHVTDGETKTQLADNTGMSLTQLVLDHTYTINFDWESYFTDINRYKGYEAPAGWTRYIEQKYVAFPFAVEVNGTYYDVFGDGYTDWVPVGPSTTSFTFYIPSWAEEGLYYDPNGAVYSTWNSYARPMKVRVEAENMNSFFDETQLEYNGDKSNYVATFFYPCQVSGIIYDFQVVSVRDSMNFATADWVDEAGMDIFNFVKESERTSKLQAEKNVGQNNRLGLPYMRYTLDGTMTASWNYANTLPFVSGKSVYGNNTGYLVKGNTIAFTLKTIANLTGKSDYIKLTPNYRYYASDGTLYDTDDIDIYYLAGSNLIKMGSTEDYDNMKPNSLYTDGGAIWYEKSYFDYYYNTFESTADHKAKLWNDSAITENYVKLGHMDESYCVGEIKLDQSLSLWTGNEEELEKNLKAVNSASSALRYADNLNSFNMTAPQIYDLSGQQGYNYYNKGMTTDETYDSWAFESSMQTWYGKYTIPSQLYVCPKGALEDYIENEVDYIDFTEDFWLPDDGTLVLNFDITSYMDGHKHLKYYGPASSSYDMWSKEHGNPTPTDSTYRPGDVGKIELKYSSVREHYNPGILYIN